MINGLIVGIKKMCCCKREIKNFNGEIYSGYYFDTVEMDIYNLFLLIELKKNGKQSGWLDVKINYCPFCGEKLNE